MVAQAKHPRWPASWEMNASQPIDWMNPINRDLVFCFDGQRDLAGGSQITLQGNAARIADPLVGQAVALDGSGDRISVAHSPRHVGMSEFTLSAWVHKAAKDIKPFGKWQSGGGGFILRESSGALQGYAGANTGGSFSFGALPGWHLYTMVCQSSTLTLYRDAQADATTVAISGSVPNVTNTLYIGSEYDTLDEQDGRIAWARIWRRALCPAEVWQLWAPPTRWQMLRPRITRPAMLLSPGEPEPAATRAFFFRNHILRRAS